MNSLTHRRQGIGEAMSSGSFSDRTNNSCPFLEVGVPAADPVLDSSVLALFRHGESPTETGDPRVVHLPLPLLIEQTSVDLWRSRSPVRTGREGIIGYAENDSVFFAQLPLQEAGPDQLAEATCQTYRHALAFASARGYPNVSRMWNVVPRINQGEGDRERYKQFCIGRSRAFDQLLPEGSPLPAASCVGSKAGEGLVYFLAFRRPGLAVENPRQVSAFLYPREYGPQSPSFSRAILHAWPDRAQLYISGTASIVGHESSHVCDANRQLEEAARNVDVLMRCAAERIAVPTPRLDQLSELRVYLRREDDLETVRHGIQHLIGSGAPVSFLRADICRTPLLVEIEGLWSVALG